jgi:hypothetical protein
MEPPPSNEAIIFNWGALPEPCLPSYIPFQITIQVFGKDVPHTICQCFMETCTGDLAKAYTNKAYQEKEERYTMKNENQCIL